MSFSSKPVSRANQAQAETQSRPDFEHNLVEFQLEFFELVAGIDPGFDLDLLRNNPNPPVETPVRAATDHFIPMSKEELGLPLRLTGPKVINGDIFGDRIVLESEVRVKGSVYGRSEVQIGTSCVIEGSVVSGGALSIQAGSRVEGAAIGGELVLNGPVQIEGPAYSRGTLKSTGRLEAQVLYSGGAMTLEGEVPPGEVRIEAGLIMAKTGGLQVRVPVWLAEVQVAPPQQKFYLGRDDRGELRLEKVLADHPNQTQPTILTTLTDTELEKLLAELAAFEVLD